MTFLEAKVRMEPSASPVKKLRIAICGGGIGGLCLAVFLAKHSHLDVKLYEAASQFKEIGAGVMIWSRTWRILEFMGLADEFAKIAHAPPTGSQGIGFDYRRSDQPEEGRQFEVVEMAYGCIRFHRANFLDILVNHLPAGIAHFGKRLVSYSQGSSISPIALSFADDDNASCDVLIGADGIKSTVRAQMYTEVAEKTHDPKYLRHIHPVWTGTMAYRGLIRAQDIPRSVDGIPHRTINIPIMAGKYCGKNKHVVSYSISRGDVVNVVTFTSKPEKHGQPFEGQWVMDCEQKELLDSYSGWEPEVVQLLSCIKNPTRWAIHHLEPLPFYHKNRVVLVGDSAHAMSPHQGAGAGQAIEDAFLLSRLLLKATPDRLVPYLDAYQTVRIPAATKVQLGSYESGLMYEFNSEYGDDYGRLGPAIQRQWHWIDKPSLEEELETAFTMAEKPLLSRL